jgi:ATP-dependent DNA helicase RecG
VSAVANSLENRSVHTLQGVGPRLTERLKRLGVRNVADLLFHLPFRYQDRTHLTPIGKLRPGDEAVIEAEVILSQVSRQGRRTLLCRVRDGSGSLTLRFFHFGPVQQRLLGQVGTRLRCFGEIRDGPLTLEMIHPEWHCLDRGGTALVETHLTPVYPTTAGLPQFILRTLTEQALLCLESDPKLLRDYLPASLLKRLQLPSLPEAVHFLHRPPPGCSPATLARSGHPARKRLAFEELLAHQLSLRRLRELTQLSSAPALGGDGALLRRFLGGLPFVLTSAQLRAIAEIESDLALSRPMMRLLQGDVGSGKTVVAAAATLRTVENSLQVAIMAPTELLAEQHYHNFRNWLKPLQVEIGWLSGKLKGETRKTALERICSGHAQVVVGTHALFQEGVVFADLALAIIDEQQRFGVHQRLNLREKGQRGRCSPHQLIMTATPIPRTLAMSAYADLDTSIIDELPPGRTSVRTVVMPDSRRDEVIQRLRLACRAGRQAYWVCTVIEESEAISSQAAADTAELLIRLLPELRIGLVHGRLKPAERQAMMAAFKAGGLDLMVATTVIEVGVDVPNASLMVIENAERFGLSQLHQLRGRVGRGSKESSCVLMYRSPLSEQARLRLEVLRHTNNGFEIARRDLEIRGPGEVLGTRQTGALPLRVADLLRDEDLLPQVQAAAEELLRNYPDQIEAIIQRWIGEGGRYAEV